MIDSVFAKHRDNQDEQAINLVKQNIREQLRVMASLLDSNTQTELPKHVFSVSEVSEVSWRSPPEAGCPSLVLPVGMQRSIDMLLALSVDATGTITDVRLASLPMSSTDDVSSADKRAPSIEDTAEGRALKTQLAQCQFDPLQKEGNIVAGIVMLPIYL